MYLKPFAITGTLITLAIMACLPAGSQYIPNRLINSGEIITTGNKLHDEEKYAEAIAAYHQVPRSDTNYADVLYELSYSHYAAKRYDSAVYWALKGIQLFPAKKAKYQLLTASAYDEMDSVATALKWYTDGIAANPHDHSLYYNRALTYKAQKQTELARKDLEQCILVNPWFASAHFAMGEMYFDQGQLVPGMLAYQTYLMLSPEGRYLQTTINAFSGIAKVTDEVMELASRASFRESPSFEPIQQILLSKLALDKKYELKASLDDHIVRQIQVCNEQLQYQANDKSFAMQFYVPLLEMIYKQGDFEPMIYTIFAGLNIESVKSWNKKNDKRSEAFFDKVRSYLNESRTSRVLDRQKRIYASPCYLWEDGVFVAEGPCKTLDLSAYYGYWKIYYPDGQLKQEGLFTGDKKKEGLWTTYHENGAIQEKTMYKNGMEDGASDGWFRNGNVAASYQFAAGKQEGLQKSWFFNGLPKLQSMYRNDLKNGEEKEFQYSGELTAIAMYANDLQDGLVRTFHANGRVKDSMTYKAGKPEGDFFNYNDKGILLMQGKFLNGLKEGLWITNDDQGKLKEKTIFTGGDITGEFTEYHSNGRLSRKGTYVKKKPDGKIESFGTDGILHSVALYDKGRLREVAFYDKQGKEISKSVTSRGLASISFYDEQGVKISDGPFTREGLKSGLHKNYYPSGAVSVESEYNEGLSDGIQVGYYTNRKKRYETAYKEDVENGLVTWYHTNGRKSFDVWALDGQKQQHAYYYDELGNLSSQDYFLSQDLHGYCTNLYGPGVIQFENKYATGWLEEVKQFDTLGNLLSVLTLDKGNGDLPYKHFNGQPMVKGRYEHYQLQGAYFTYHYDGSLSGEFNYQNGKLHGPTTSYYFGGKKSVEGRYAFGQKTGAWTWYFPNGKVSEEEQYEQGNLQGTIRFYKEEGGPDRNIAFENGERHGPYRWYNDSNQLIVQLNFEKGMLQSYTYTGPDGKLASAVAVPGGNGMVNAFYQTGTKSAEIAFKDSDQNGVFKLFHTNGKLYVEASYDAGFLQGERKTYFNNGKLKKTEKFEAGSRFGKQMTYAPNGTVVADEEYYGNEKHRTNSYFAPDGKPLSKQIYYYGILLNSQ